MTVPDGEPGMGEIWRLLVRLERAVVDLVSKELFNAKMEAHELRVKELEDSYRWLTRTVLGAVLLALVSIALGISR